MSSLQTRSLIYTCRPADSDIHIIIKVSLQTTITTRLCLCSDTPHGNFATEQIIRTVWRGISFVLDLVEKAHGVLVGVGHRGDKQRNVHKDRGACAKLFDLSEPKRDETGQRKACT